MHVFLDDEIPTVKKTTTLPGSSWVHKNVTTSNQNKPKNDQIVSYDPQHRNPAHAGANKTNHWELSLMRQHFHPSVELFAQTIMEGKDIKYTGRCSMIHYFLEIYILIIFFGIVGR